MTFIYRVSHVPAVAGAWRRSCQDNVLADQAPFRLKKPSMNRREAITAGIASIAAAVALPPDASAFAPEARAGIWINRWGPRRGGWINRWGPGRGGWINGWGPGRGGWINRRGGPRRGSWINRW